MRSKGVKNLIVIESPGKQVAITRYLEGILDNYKVLASFGHVLDLPKNKLGFDPDNNYNPEYIIMKDKFSTVRELKSYVGKDTMLWLFSDDDREGEKIAETVATALKIPESRTRRLRSHSITKDAIVNAVKNYGTVNHNLADAATARRVIDRAVGYKLSPLLWTKIAYGLSAGRLQSAALRIIVDRENEIDVFIPEEFWKVKLNVLDEPKFTAELAKCNNKPIKVTNEQEANVIKDNCDGQGYVLNSIVEKDSKRNPAPPFTTSTLQQEASRKLGYSVKQTMNVAQKLYEGNVGTIPGHTGGLITYMRTDSMNIAPEGVTQIFNTIKKVYGNEYSIDKPRHYSKKKQKVEAQEAHECVRPVNMNILPSEIEKYADKQFARLYALIWKRTMATQMAQAKVATTTYEILGGKDKEYTYVAKGTKILFPGFMKVYIDGDDDNEDNSTEKYLPNVPEGTVFNNTNIDLEQHFTKPPARYNEAGLVKKLETEGIGRPSTYASAISVILAREYAEMNKDKRLEPTKIGKVVNDYLVTNFPEIVDLKFTARLEKEFDKIAKGEVKWRTVMDDFYKKFIEGVKKLEGTDRVQYSESKLIGVDPATKKNVYVNSSRYGLYLTIGETDKENGIKPVQTSPLPKGIKMDDIDMEKASYYLKVPRVLGMKDDMPVSVNIGRFGGYVKYRDTYYSLPKEEDIYSVELPKALEIIKSEDERKAKSLLLDIEDEERGRIQVLNGRYGNAYIKAFGKGKKQKKGNYKLPKSITEDDARKLTKEEVFTYIDKSSTPKTKRK